jgi:hypothetical protein
MSPANPNKADIIAEEVAANGPFVYNPKADSSAIQFLRRAGRVQTMLDREGASGSPR